MEQRKGWSRVQQALEFLELELETASMTLGKKSPETIDLERKLCLACCKQGAALMDEGDWVSSLNILRRAEALSVRYADLQLEVFETLALYYGGTGKHLRALSYLDRLWLLTPESPLGRAKLHLNYCAILSQLSKHDQAHTHALKAVFLLQDLVILQSLRGLDLAETELETLASAYYNLAVEQEYLHEVCLYIVPRSEEMA